MEEEDPVFLTQKKLHVLVPHLYDLIDIYCQQFPTCTRLAMARLQYIPCKNEYSSLTLGAFAMVTAPRH